MLDLIILKISTVLTLIFSVTYAKGCENRQIIVLKKRVQLQFGYLVICSWLIRSLAGLLPRACEKEEVA